ncbi:FUSC family protein [Specibacter sp. AOP5-B1-6]|uniref:FUSC family protein n=1 Tax=Specibacter sp. AOP5-B1-6 TaxID=3457653 RepID=UPI00402B5503
MQNLKTWAKSTVGGQRVLLAVKAALAVGLSWFLAPYMPGVADDYPYYAPLGALVTMYPTFMGSVRTGLQTLAGLLLGVLLATGVLLLENPNIVSISVAVGIGVLLAGLPRLGAGREYVPVATLLVLIIGGQDAETFSLGYGIQMGLGVLVGLAVNVTIFPPLKLDAARLRISRGRNALMSQLEDVARALVEQWPPEHEEWASRHHLLEAAVGDIRGAVHEAHESHQANPRAYLRSRHRLVSESFDDLAVLENVTFHVRNLSEVLAAAIWEGPLELRLSPELCEPLSHCLQATADVVRAWDEDTVDAEIFDTAGNSLADLTTAVAVSRENEASALTPGAAVALDVQRILALLRRRLLPDDDDENSE